MKVILKESNDTPPYVSLHVITSTSNLESKLFSSKAELYKELDSGIELYDETDVDQFFEQVTDEKSFEVVATIKLNADTGEYKLNYK